MELLESSDLDETLCAHLKCPITDMIFRDPVYLEDGFIYEKAAIQKWLKSYHNSPVTKKSVRCDKFIIAIPIKQQVDEFLEKNPEYAKIQFEKSYRHLDNTNEINRLLRSNINSKIKLKEWQQFTDFNAKKISSSTLFMSFLKKCTDDGALIHLIDNIDNWEHQYSEGKRLIHLFLEYKKSFDVVEHLVNKAIDIEVKDRRGNYPVHYVCQFSNFRILRFFAERNANLDVLGKDDVTLLHCAAYNNSMNLEMLKYLVDQGVNINGIRKSGEHVFHSICKNGKVEHIEWFLTKEAGLNCITKNDLYPVTCLLQENKKIRTNDKIRLAKIMLGKMGTVNYSYNLCSAIMTAGIF